MMEKTVLVIAANSLSREPCGHPLTFDLTLGKGKAASKTVPRTVWSSCVQGVVKYVRVTFDLFADKRQVCVAAVDYCKCQPVNSWRDEDQELGKVLAGFQKFGQPSTVPVAPPTGHTPSLLGPCVQGVQYGVRCLAQLTATQYAATTCPGHKPPSNQGRLILLCSLHNPSDIKDLEEILVRLVRSENSDIRQKGDPARLTISQCQLVVVNSYTTPTSDIRDAPLTQLSSHVSSVVYSFPAHLLVDKCLSLCRLHHNLTSTLITGIPMKEEQSGCGSANYDVELIHLSEAHRDVLRGGFVLGGRKGEGGRERLTLKWSTPKTSSLELQPCTSAYRVTPTNVTSRPTICLVNFVLSGKPVVLEQPRKGPQKLISHVLINHAGSMYLHCIPSTRNHVEDPPSISEGWGGRITDYRISDFGELVVNNMLTPISEDRTKVPHHFPLQLATARLERECRQWPLVFAETILSTLGHELHPLPSVIRRDHISEQDFEECKTVIKTLQSKELAGESLSVPNTGSRSKGVKRDEQYRLLWVELETLTDTFRTNSELHQRLAEIVAQATSHAPSMQHSRKTPQPAATGTAEDMLWTSNDQFGERSGTEVPGTGVWERDRGNGDLRTQRHERGTGPRYLPRPAPPIGSVASLWEARQVTIASSGHTEFAGRMTFGPKADLYLKMRSNSSIVPPDQDT